MFVLQANTGELMLSTLFNPHPQFFPTNIIFIIFFIMFHLSKNVLSSGICIILSLDCHVFEDSFFFQFFSV